MTYDSAVEEMRRQASLTGNTDTIRRTEEIIRRAEAVREATCHLGHKVVMAGMVSLLTTQLMVEKTTALAEQPTNDATVRMLDGVCREMIDLLVKIIKLTDVRDRLVDRAIGDVTGNTKH